MMILYNILLTFAVLIIAPYYGLIMLWTGKYRRSAGAKLGLGFAAVEDMAKGRPRIWIHAVSVGEVTAAAPIVSALRGRMPGACIVMSTSTETGHDMAESIITDATAVIYYPLDIPFIVRKVIRRVRPDIVVLTETELWPNFIGACKSLGIKVVMVNGRISPRSYKRYYRTKLFWRGTLHHIDQMGMISATDADRIIEIGMPPERVCILGNAKYDGLAARISAALAADTACRIHISPGERVFVAGSTHEGEEAIVLDVYVELLRHFPDMKLIIVPRHIDRGRAVLDLVRSSGFPDSIAMTEMNAGRSRKSERVIVVDVIGELFKIYSLATVVFCGGSLVPKGGQNILEAAAWGKTVFYGPSMDDFLNEKKLLEDIGVGFPVKNGQELLQGILDAVKDPENLMKKGRVAQETMAANRGSAGKYADLIMKTLGR
jgi:3-deoxy-D-manno-octulosonic-acid transferase